MEKNKQDELVAPTENKRIKTSLNLQKVHVEGLAKIAAGKNLTLTAMEDEALSMYLAELNNTKEIDEMLRETSGFWFERDLALVRKLLPVDRVKNLIPYQVAYLCFNLKDQKDRERVFTALNLAEELKEIDAVNRELEKASIYKGEELKGYNMHVLANELRAKLMPLQSEYLTLKIGKDAFAKLQERRPDLLADLNIDNETDKKAPFDEADMNPALETVLAVTALSKATWKALPDSMKKRLHDVVKTGKIDLAKKLVSQIGIDTEAVDLFPQIEQEAN